LNLLKLSQSLSQDGDKIDTLESCEASKNISNIIIVDAVAVVVAVTLLPHTYFLSLSRVTFVCTFFILSLHVKLKLKIKPCYDELRTAATFYFSSGFEDCIKHYFDVILSPNSKQKPHLVNSL